jgi:hypothetical protein
VLAEHNLVGLMGPVAGGDEFACSWQGWIADNDGPIWLGGVEGQGDEHMRDGLGKLFQLRGRPLKGLLGQLVIIRPAGDGTEFEEGKCGDGVG